MLDRSSRAPLPSSAGRLRRPRYSAATPNGTLIRNNQGQPSVDTMMPPSVGPATVPSATISALMPRIEPSSSGG